MYRERSTGGVAQLDFTVTDIPEHAVRIAAMAAIELNTLQCYSVILQYRREQSVSIFHGLWGFGFGLIRNRSLNVQARDIAHIYGLPPLR